MGQRLVVKLMKSDNVVALIYFHWSAYFAPAVQELKYISDDIIKAEETNEDVLLNILKGLEKRGGGIRNTPEDINKISELFPAYEFKDPELVNKNDGVISFLQENTDVFFAEAEGFASINLDTHEIKNDVLDEPDPYVIRLDGEKPFIKYEDLVCYMNPTSMTCESIQELYDFMEKRFEVE